MKEPGTGEHRAIVPDLDDPAALRRPGEPVRWTVLAALVASGACLLGVVVGIVLLGLDQQGSNNVAVTGLASVGATLAGGFAGWIARGTVTTTQRNRERRRTDPHA